MLYLLDTLTNLINTYRTFMLLIGIIASIGLCFIGYLYLKMWVSAFCFVGGMGVAYILAHHYLYGNVYAPALIALLSGIICLLVSQMIYKISVFAFASCLTGLTLWNLRPQVSPSDLYVSNELVMKLLELFPYFLILALAIGAGVFTLKSRRTAIIAVTGICGAIGAVLYLILFLRVAIIPETRLIWFGVIVLLAALGVVVQHFTTKGK